MANNPQESTPLIPQQPDSIDNNTPNPNPNPNPNPKSEKLNDQHPIPLPEQPPLPMVPHPQVPDSYGWAVHGFPVGQPIMGRGPWSSGICSCLGRHDHFCSSDLEVCLLGSVAPCVLYGSNVERLGSTTESFSNHCLSYAALYLIGNTFFGWNCLAPWFSYTSRTALRRMYNLEGSCEALTRHCGCCGTMVEDEMQREQCETACDFATHVFCHPCALCQEAREIRRRLPHPGFNNQSVVFMVPPGEQAMGRDQP